MAESELVDDSELMEDLYKILPLTVDTVFLAHDSVINCQFDTLTDLKTACKILELIFGAQGKSITAKIQKSPTKSLLQKLL